MCENNIQYGAIPSPKDIRDYTFRFQEGEEIPSSFVVSHHLVIKNQGNKPTCVAHALAEIIEFNYQKENNTYERFSTDFIYGLRNHKLYNDEGLCIREGLSIIKNFGDVFYELVPGNSYALQATEKIKPNENYLKQQAESYRISNYYRITSIEALKHSLIHNGPAIGGIKWNDDNKIKNGIITLNNIRTYYTHAVIIVGWVNNYFIVQNSWGRYWGKKGTFLVSETDLFKLFYEIYGVTDDILSVKKPNKITKGVAPCINIILNVLTKILKSLKKY